MKSERWRNLPLFFTKNKYSKINQKIFKNILTSKKMCDRMVLPNIKEDKMTVKEIAEMAKVTERRVYQLAKQLGRLPTVEEIEDRKGKRGRPKKYN